MDKKEYLIGLREKYKGLPDEIAENHKGNRVALGQLLVESSKSILEAVDADKVILDKLLDDQYHYFDKGRCDPRTPEQLREEILSTIEKAIKAIKV